MLKADWYNKVVFPVASNHIIFTIRQEFNAVYVLCECAQVDTFVKYKNKENKIYYL